MATTAKSKSADTKADTTTTDPLKDRRDGEGNLIDPPVIPEYESKLAAAHAANDDELIADLTADYTKAREELAIADQDRADRRRKREREAVA